MSERRDLEIHATTESGGKISVSVIADSHRGVSGWAVGRGPTFMNISRIRKSKTPEGVNLLSDRLTQKRDSQKRRFQTRRLPDRHNNLFIPEIYIYNIYRYYIPIYILGMRRYNWYLELLRRTTSAPGLVLTGAGDGFLFSL